MATATKLGLAPTKDEMQPGYARYTDFSRKAAKITIAFDASIILLSGLFAIFLRWGTDSGFEFILDQSPLVFRIPAIWFVSLAWENAWVLSWVAAPSELYGRVLRAGANSPTNLVLSSKRC